MKKNLLIGLDFGSDSVRALLADDTGEELASSVHLYQRWTQGLYSDAARLQFRQHPLDYLEGTEAVIRSVLFGQDSSLVRGIGVDTTGSTPCTVDAAGIPLALRPEFSENPDAMFVLWKDHTAIEEAMQINTLAKRWEIDYTRFAGGIYSPEWFWAKYLYILRHDRSVRAACCGFIEHCDWMTSHLSGSSVKASRCAAGHKAMWHQSWGGLPSEKFLTTLDPLLRGRRTKLYTETFTADLPVGTLSPEWAKKLGLSTNVVISGGALDCHMGAIGAGIKAGQLVKVIGTSTCDVMVAPRLERCISGICGQVDGSVIPGMTSLEAGQSAFGDIYAWFKRFLSYGGEISLPQLEAEAAALPPDGLLALDWLNGRRTPDSNALLTGVISGINLGMTAPMIYRALVEATAFGAERIAEHFRKEGIKIDSVVAAGGIARKSKFVMQTYSDVLNMPVQVVESDQACALGAAMFAAAASGVHPDIRTAMEKMKSGIYSEYRPDPDKVEVYKKQYARYLACAEWTEREIMKNV